MKKSLFSLALTLLLITALATTAFAASYTATLMGQMDIDVSEHVDEWGLGDLPQATTSFNLGENAVIYMEFDEPVKFTGNWTGIETTIPISGDDEAEATGGKILSFKVDGVDLGSKAVPLVDRDGMGTVTIDIARQWGGSYDAYGLADMDPFSTLEITFIFPDSNAEVTEAAVTDSGTGSESAPQTHHSDNIILAVGLLALAVGLFIVIRRKVSSK